MFYQLRPSIPLRSPKASGEAIACIDYGPEHNVLWCIVDDETGQLWWVPNGEVRAFKNYSLGRRSVDYVGEPSGRNEV